MILHNYMENIVSQNVEKVMAQFGGCLCEKCRTDVMAIALNSLPPRYSSSDVGAVYAKLGEMSQTEQANIITVLAIAAEKVTANPRHTAEGPFTLPIIFAENDRYQKEGQ